jgi:hypothetical protein
MTAPSGAVYVWAGAFGRRFCFLDRKTAQFALKQRGSRQNSAFYRTWHLYDL